MTPRFSWDDHEDVRDVYEAVYPALSRHCLRILRDGTLASDAAQETFARVIAHRPVLPTVTDVRRYLFRAATNVCINLLRQGRRVGELAEMPCHGDAADNEDCRDTALTSALTVARVLDDSNSRDRAIFVWHYLGGASQSDIAAYLGVTRRTVYSRLRVLHRAARADAC